MAKRPLYTNRLVHEKSPYLQQHAHNPVDWFSWGEAAFHEARAQDKPIFLSIGYATCHWCHVMEKESFENVEVAQLMNETFINIKVDREELPEVDSLYMEFAQSMMAGAAGWPLNVILTPDLQPFFAATYLPAQSRHGLMGLTDLILRIKEVWQGEEREQVLLEAEKIVGVFAQGLHNKGEEICSKEQVTDSAELLYRMADSTYGGMKGIPKFPVGYQFNFMLRYATKEQDSRALFLVELTLDMMQRGGIYDHLGGGFSRYSVDERWLVPHFEKMLYDNALLAHSYLEAWQTTKKPLYRQICEEVLEYILRDLTHPEGGFYSAEDADTEGKEGYYYTWTLEEVQEVLGIEESMLFCEFFDITEAGNFEGRNILHTEYRLEEFAGQIDKDPIELAELINSQKQKLYKARKKRVRPFVDDKILTAWNGLMIYTMAEAGCTFREPRYFEAASKAASFIRKNLWVEGQLLRRWRDGEALHSAGLDDFAFLIRGLLALFEAGQGTEWLSWAMELGNILDHQFKVEGGAYYQTDGTDPSIIIRKCQFSDGSEPSGNSIHCENLLRFYQLTHFPDYLEFAEDILKAVKTYIDNYPPGYCYQMINLNRYYDTSAPTVIIALNEKEQYREELLHLLFTNYVPHKALIWRREDDEKLFSLIPMLRENPPIDGQTTLYICTQGVCKEPITDLAEMLDVIHHL